MRVKRGIGILPKTLSIMENIMEPKQEVTDLADHSLLIGSLTDDVD